MLVQKRGRMAAEVRFLGGGDWWKGWREEDGPGMQGHDYRLSGPRTVNMKTVRGKELCSLLLDSQVKVSADQKTHGSVPVSKTLPIPAHSSLKPPTVPDGAAP